MKLLTAPRTARTKPILVAVAVLAVGLTLLGPGEPADPAATAQSDVQVSTSSAVVPAASRPFLELPGRSTGDHEILQVFGGHSWYVPPPPAPVARVVATRPVAPPLPFTYLGSFLESGGKPVYYLVKGDRAYDVRVGETLDGIYTLDAADDGRLMFTYLPLKERQTLGVGK